jgi:hypothetical protein
VVHPGSGAGFLEKTVAKICPPGEMRVHDLDRDVPLKGQILRFEDGAHPTLAEELGDPVAVEGFSD